MNLKRILLLSAVLLGLSACGGGGGGGDSDDDANSVRVNAGSDISVNESETVTLSGSASGANSFTYAWSTTNTDITITHADTSSADASFDAPVVRTSPLTINLTLTATPSEGSAVTDTVVVTVNPVNAAPTSVITVTQDSRFDTNVFPGNVTLTLDGLSSTDSDPIDSAAPISGYQWAQTAGTDITDGATLDQATLTLTTPSLATTEDLQFSLTVTDNEGGTGIIRATVTVLDVTQAPPVVDAGVDLEVSEGETILLTGSATSLSADATPYTYLWTNTTTPVATITDATDGTTSAIAPSVSSAQTLTFNLSVTDQFGNSESNTVNVTVRPMSNSLINDTGMTSIAEATSQSSSASNDYPGQDGDYGRDRISANSLLAKAGNGSRAFDFTKLDNLGEEIDESSTDWSCVRDNVTGLIWEVKVTATGLHDNENTYTWYNVTSSENGGSAGDETGAGASCSIANCNTSAFIAAVNSAGLCGFFDWRLPNHNELSSILHFGQTGQVLIDTDYFPNTTSSSNGNIWYWTIVPNADGSQGEVALSAWAIDFSTGNDNFLNKTNAANVRLVRAGR